ncbi:MULTISPECIES: OPT family oligopeptide transporter [Gilliamella]|uniref:Oligopeptide transporter, OPT family n=1 Tax=Gilliamella apicola TaxID=1196095 RepID=A0A556SWE6_9GAMM|nr:MULTISPECIES: oligopeptide transporter, OPT family [Gilliamella]MBI0030428.1 oligopeptide transporter, OPT family [Gilliamella sp. B14384G15]MBI0056940.1 oligopeptide transporter, OPT family [Gilliamella sp. B14384G12]MBI0093802.1 oligopeptide transporter, OPT family [Gilliamella sp. W8136]TSK05467.1 oligopeptide transporter, OPT family [Gilliamella apicola]
MNNLRELTLRGTILGAFITVIFTASNVYLGLKVGLTFSSAIPAAVISMAILRLFSGSTILENNMVQTQASAAGTLSSIIFVLPGLLMIGYWQSFPFWLTLAICAAGGMLGVLFSIPLRHVMVVKSNLPYPEGVAAAEILKAGSKTEGNDANDGLKDILFGGVVASIVSLFTNGFRILSDSTAYWFTAGKSIFQLPMGFSLALLSAGYLIGIMSGIAVLIGTIIAWLFGIPILSLISDYDSSQPLSQIAMGFWAKDIRFIGAGTIAIAAIWTLLTLIKPVIEGLKISFKTMRSDVSASDIAPTDQDLSPKTIFLIMAGMLMILLITFYAFIADSGLSLGVAWSLVICAVLFAFIMGFLVAAACGYMAGLVGSSASPISGIAIVAAIVISLILLGLGEINGMLDSIEGTNFATALALFTTSAVLAVACISNDNLQDLKTGYLVQATPWKQQVALLIGCIVGAIVIAPILEILYNAYGFTGAVPRPDMDQSQVLAAPQATLMTTIAKGIFSHNLDWTMILIGLVVGAVIIIIDLVLAANNSKFRLPALAVGLGIYLPPSITMPIFVGTVLSWIIKRNAYAKATTLKLNPEEEYKKVDRKAALIASGLIVGESLVGVILAVVIVISIASGGSDAPLAIPTDLGVLPQYLGLLVFVTICVLFIRRALSVLKR